MVLSRKDGRTDGRSLRRGMAPPRYNSHFDAPPPAYTGPIWIGKQLKAPPYGVGPQWVGKRIVVGPVPRVRSFSRGHVVHDSGWMDT